MPLLFLRGKPTSPPPDITLEKLADCGRALGWEVHPGFQEDDGEDVLFLDKQANPDATVLAGANQPGALYVVEMPSPKAAGERTLRPNITSEVWGRYWPCGKLLMMDMLVDKSAH